MAWFVTAFTSATLAAQIPLHTLALKAFGKIIYFPHPRWLKLICILDKWQSFLRRRVDRLLREWSSFSTSEDTLLMAESLLRCDLSFENINNIPFSFGVEVCLTSTCNLSSFLDTQGCMTEVMSLLFETRNVCVRIVLLLRLISICNHLPRAVLELKRSSMWWISSSGWSAGILKTAVLKSPTN